MRIYPGKRRELRIDANFFLFSPCSRNIRQYTACDLTLSLSFVERPILFPEFGVAFLRLMNLSATFAMFPGSVEV